MVRSLYAHSLIVNNIVNADEKEIKLKHLLNETKRLVLLIVRIQSGKSLLDVLEAPVTEHEEDLFRAQSQKDLEQYQLSQEKKSGQDWRMSNDVMTPIQASQATSSNSVFYGSGSYFCLKTESAL
jgi:hypothetical protein